MGRKSNHELEKVTIRLNVGDAERLRSYYPRLGYNEAIRRLVSHHLRQLDERAQRRLSSQDLTNPLLREENPSDGST